MKNWPLFFLFYGAASLAQPGDFPGKAVPGIKEQVWSITEVMFHDVVNPPAAARFYAYSLLSGYEVLCQLDSSVNRWQQQLKNYPVFKAGGPEAYDKELAVLYAILETGRLILPSGYLLEAKQQELTGHFIKKGVEEKTRNASVKFAVQVAEQITAYARMDGYFRLSTLQRYQPLKGTGNWQPTAPEYMPAVEPHWKTIRTFLIDSASQFLPAPPVLFDKEEGSDFMKLTQEVYRTGQSLTMEQKLIADFWDCNPFAVQFQGHMSIGLKKISPGGHWMSIAGQVSNEAGLGFEQTLLVHTILALTLHDAFISCWDEKYRSNRIRPETAINRYIDPKWKPLLQTPPFPEYSSGHSVISTAAAGILTSLLGDDFSFIDSTETYIGLPARKFSSFQAAAAEARISRLYGGIHFRDAIEQGEEQGRRVGEYIIRKLQLRRLRE